MKPGKVIFWMVFAFCAYHLFNYTVMYTQGDVIAYKRFAKAVMKNDDFLLRQVTQEGNLLGKIENSRDAREKLFENGDIVFTYYSIENRRVSEDGKIVYLSANQVSRVNPEQGEEKMWGAREIKIPHTVQLVLENDAWMIVSFSDPAIGSN